MHLLKLFLHPTIILSKNILKSTHFELVVVMGLVLGVVGATKQWKEKGTISFLSRLHATPELDEINQRDHETSPCVTN